MVTIRSHRFEVGRPFLEGGCADRGTFLPVGRDVHLIHLPIGDVSDRSVTQFRIGECAGVELDVEVTDSHNRLLALAIWIFVGSLTATGPVRGQFRRNFQRLIGRSYSALPSFATSASYCACSLARRSLSFSASLLGVGFSASAFRASPLAFRSL